MYLFLKKLPLCAPATWMLFSHIKPKWKSVYSLLFKLGQL